MKHNIWLGVLLCGIASISWGAMFPVANDAFHYINPFYFTLIRYIPVVVILVLLLYFIEGKKSFRLEGKGLAIWFFGTMGFTIYNIFIFWGQDLLQDQGVLLASIMEALAPILSIFILWFVYNNRPHRFTMIAIAGAFIGVFLVVTNGDFSALFEIDQLMPLFILLLAALGWAFYTIGGSTFEGWSVLRYSTLSCLYGTLTAILFVGMGSALQLIEVPSVSNIITIKYHMLFMVLLPGLFALLFWNKGVVLLKPINAILFINLAPVTTVLIRLIQGHSISIYEISGVSMVCAMIIANNMYHRILQSRADKQRPQNDQKLVS
ncbi:MAG TPA: DMT family transporter [Pseudogracilibacillus sp.]|nr:DMT family transporter [Pseudogracilibacillus sp.]